MRKMMMAVGVALAFAFTIVASALGIVPVAATSTNGTLDITLMHPVEGRTFWYGGAVMPVVVQLSENGNPITDASVMVWVNGAPAIGPGKAMVDNNFVNLGDGLYQYNLNTKPYPAGPGSEPIMVKVIADASGMSATLEFSMILH